MKNESDYIPKLPSPLQEINLPGRPDLVFYIKRDDLIHPFISGNKWRKLSGIKIDKQKQIVTFGGAFSNHIVATAVWANYNKLNATAYIRTDSLDDDNPTLIQCREYGMKLIPMPRHEYSKKDQQEILTSLRSNHDNALIIPEGGSSPLAIPGVQQLIHEIEKTQKKVDYFICSLGTGATASGIISAIKPNAHLLIFPAIKGWNSQGMDKVQWNLMHNIHSNYSIHYHSSQKAYAKKDLALFHFLESFLLDHNILLDPIYTGKAMYGLMEKIDTIEKNKSIVFVHSGGNQAWRGYFYRFPKLALEIPTIYKAVMG